MILLYRIQTVLDCRVIGIKVSSYSEYKVKNGLSRIGQLKNLGQSATYYIAFDEWKYIRMYTVYVGVLNQNRPVVRKTLFWGTASLQFSSKGNRKFLKQLGETDVFSTYVSHSRSAPPP